MTENSDKTPSPNSIEPNNTAPKLRKERRPSRYAAAQERRNAAKARDNRFYAAIFSLVTLVVLFALVIAAVMVNGASIDTRGLGDVAAPWVLGLSKLEVAGLGIVALIAVGMWRKITK